PQAVKTLAILSIVGSSIWGLLMFIGMLWMIFVVDTFSNLIPGASSKEAVAGITIAFILLIGLNVLGLVGAVKMMGGKKSGFILYAIGTGLWVLLMLFIGGRSPEAGGILYLVSGLASIGFIIAFGVKMKEMPN